MLNSAVTSTGSGQLLAGAGSVVYQNGVTLAGQVNTTGTGVIQASNSTNNYLNAVALNGALDLASNQSIERVTNGLTLQNGATVSINSNEAKHGLLNAGMILGMVGVGIFLVAIIGFFAL